MESVLVGPRFHDKCAVDAMEDVARIFVSGPPRGKGCMIEATRNTRSGAQGRREYILSTSLLLLSKDLVGLARQN